MELRVKWPRLLQDRREAAGVLARLHSGVAGALDLHGVHRKLMKWRALLVTLLHHIRSVLVHLFDGLVARLVSVGLGRVLDARLT